MLNMGVINLVWHLHQAFQMVKIDKCGFVIFHLTYFENLTRDILPIFLFKLKKNKILLTFHGSILKNG